MVQGSGTVHRLSFQELRPTFRWARHGGKLTGPPSQAGRDNIATLHATYDGCTKEKRLRAQKSVELDCKVSAVSFDVKMSAVIKWQKFFRERR